MVAVVERKEDARGDMIFEFEVYLSPKDGERTLGYLAPYGVVVGNRKAVWIKTDFGIDACQAFLKVHELAEKYGVDAIVVNDPKGLFPPEQRPELPAALA